MRRFRMLVLALNFALFALGEEEQDERARDEELQRRLVAIHGQAAYYKVSHNYT